MGIHSISRSTKTSMAICALLNHYLEDPKMPKSLKAFADETIQDLLEELPIELRLKGVPPENRLAGLSAEDMLRALSPEALELLKRRLLANGSTPGTSPGDNG